jgi:uncharacterized membrane protein (DUF373 family)
MKNSTIQTTPPAYKTFLLNNEWHSYIIGFFVGILMISIYLWMLAGIVSILLHLYHSFFADWSRTAEHMIKDVLITLALLEFIRILQSYLILGRVRVTFIIDVALVVLIGELIGFWYQKVNISEIFLGLGVISALVLLRTVTSKFSPIHNIS